MKERPIVFSAEMVRAILEGRKTMTRRLVKHPHITNANELDEYFGGGTCEDCDACFYTVPKDSTRICVKCPYGVPGDRLWVKEAWRPKCMNCEDDDVRGGWYGVMPEYQADDAQGKWVEVDSAWWEKAYAEGDYGRKWRNSRFMPRWASRILLEIVSVRVERLQEISASDVLREGLEFGPVMEMDPPPYLVAQEIAPHNPGIHRLFIEPFKELWDTIHAKKPESQWDANPFCWVIEFKVVTA